MQKHNLVAPPSSLPVLSFVSDTYVVPFEPSYADLIRELHSQQTCLVQLSRDVISLHEGQQQHSTSPPPKII